MRAGPDLAVVILSYEHAPGAVLAAVDSILAQSEEAEIVVSHSGSPDTSRFLRRERPQVMTITTGERRLPGAARNAGVDATGAPFVSFLAGDCRARPGWVAGRMARHRRGVAAVASTLVPLARRLPSTVSCLLTHGYRLPGVGAREELRFGVSYDRELLTRFGPFPGDIRFAEDTVLNGRLLSAGVSIELAEDVVTEHAYPMTIGRLLGDQFERGRARGRLDVPSGVRLVLAVGELLRVPRGIRSAHRSPAVGPVTWPGVVPLLLAGAVARAAGVAVGGSADPAATAELEARRQAQLRLGRASPGR